MYLLGQALRSGANECEQTRSGRASSEPRSIATAQSETKRGWPIKINQNEINGLIRAEYICMMIRVLGLLILMCLGQMLLAATSRYRVMWRSDPSTTAVIAWDQVSGSAGKVYYDTYDHGRDVQQYAYSKTVTREQNLRSMRNCFVRLDNLQPNTRYFFVVVDQESVSRRFFFETAPGDQWSRLSVIAGGDSRNRREQRQNANILVSKLNAHVVVFGGDMTGLDKGSQWIKWMDDWQLTISRNGRITPIVAARGNHERSNETLVGLFDVPHPDVYYALNFGGNLLRVYTLNTMNPVGGDQYAWLKGDLAQNQDKTWMMAQYHHPMRPHTRVKSERELQRKLWGKAFFEYGVDVVVECDAHVVKTTYPIRPDANGDEGFVRDPNGTVYVGEGCWGAPIRSPNDAKSWTRAIGSFNQFKWMWIDQNGIEIRTVKTDNARQVAALDDGIRFDLPRGIDIWNPENGSGPVLQIGQKNRVSQSSPTLSPTKATPQNKSLTIQPKKISAQGGDILIPINVSDYSSKDELVLWRSLDGGQSFQPCMRVDPSPRVKHTMLLTDRGAVYQDGLLAQYYIKHKRADGTTAVIDVPGDIELQPWRGITSTQVNQGAASFVYEYTLKKNQRVQIKLLNRNLDVVTTESYTATAGSNTAMVATGSLKRGEYLLVIQGTENKFLQVLKVQ